MKLLSNSNTSLVKPSELEGFISREYGIKTDIIMIKGNPSIKCYNHFSLFTLIGKLRRNFDFAILHSKEANEFTITINTFYE